MSTDTDTQLIHHTYRYLQRSARLLGLTWPQWLAIAIASLATYALATLTPIPSPWNYSLTMMIVGAPIAVMLAVGPGSFDVAAQLRGLLTWRRELRGLYLPGAAAENGGYQSHEGEGEDPSTRRLRRAQLIREHLR